MLFARLDDLPSASIQRDVRITSGNTGLFESHDSFTLPNDPTCDTREEPPPTTTSAGQAEDPTPRSTTIHRIKLTATRSSDLNSRLKEWALELSSRSAAAGGLAVVAVVV